MRYRRTQFGWVLVLGLAIPAAILLAVSLSGENWTLLVGLIPILVVVPLFGWLTVSLDDEAVVAQRIPKHGADVPVADRPARKRARRRDGGFDLFVDDVLSECRKGVFRPARKGE